MQPHAALLLLMCGLHLLLAAPPVDLTNFQDEYACNNLTVRIVRPSTVADVQEAVRLHAQVKGVGEGHSWNQPFFCANGNATAPPTEVTASSVASKANIILTTIRPLDIIVDEENLAVDVDAGVKTIDLITFLGNYVTKRSPTGYMLPAYPWFVYQSIGGAVATGTHGSSLTWNSLSHQVLSLTMVLANGTLRTFTPETDPFLMRAVRVSVGQLGIITRLKIRLVKEQPVQRTLNILPSSGFLALLEGAQAQYRHNKTLPTWVDETEFFWITQRSEFMKVSYKRGDVADPAERHNVLASWEYPDNTTVYNTSMSLLQNPALTRMEQLPLAAGTVFEADGLGEASQAYIQDLNSTVINTPLNLSDPAVSAYDGGRSRAAERKAQEEVALGSKWDVPPPKAPTELYAVPGMASLYIDISRAGVLSLADNSTHEAHEAYLYQPQAMINNIRTVLYDQYEFMVPVATMADCWRGLLNVVYDGDIDGLNETLASQDKGFRTAPLIRFVGKEDGLLAYTVDGPHIFLNIEDYLFYNSGRKINTRFKAAAGYLRSAPACGSAGLNHSGARLHWGKAGWPDPGCWHGDQEYPSTWCDFGCAKMALDPQGKFTDSAPDRFTWEGVDLGNCCGANGFLHSKLGCECKVKHSRSRETCPPAPYYTNR